MGGTGHSLRHALARRRYHYPNAWVNWTPGLNSTQVHADDLYGLIRDLRLPPVYLVASSYGGDIALLVALQHPDVVRSLALGEPGLAHWLLQFADGPELSAIRERLWATFQPAAQRGDLEVAARRSPLCAGCVERQPFRSPTHIHPAARAGQCGPVGRGAGAPPPGLATYSREEAQTLAVPALLLTGDRSSGRFLRVAEELGRCMPHTEQAVIPDADHLLHAMNPHAYNQTVLAYLARQEETSQA